MSTTAAIAIVVHRRAMTQSRTFAYPAWIHPWVWALSSSSSPSVVGAVATRRPRHLRNQYASTGTIVSATSSEASIATVTVNAKGRNNTPDIPPTSAIGRNTATVVMVEAVIAAPTSRTASTIVSVRDLP